MKYDLDMFLTSFVKFTQKHNGVYYDNTMVFFKVHYYNLLLFRAYYLLYDFFNVF